MEIRDAIMVILSVALAYFAPGSNVVCYAMLVLQLWLHGIVRPHCRWTIETPLFWCALGTQTVMLGLAHVIGWRDLGVRVGLLMYDTALVAWGLSFPAYEMASIWVLQHATTRSMSQQRHRLLWLLVAGVNGWLRSRDRWRPDPQYMSQNRLQLLAVALVAARRCSDTMLTLPVDGEIAFDAHDGTSMNNVPPVDNVPPVGNVPRLDRVDVLYNDSVDVHRHVAYAILDSRCRVVRLSEKEEEKEGGRGGSWCYTFEYRNSYLPCYAGWDVWNSGVVAGVWTPFSAAHTCASVTSPAYAVVFCNRAVYAVPLHVEPHRAAPSVMRAPFVTSPGEWHAFPLGRFFVIWTYGTWQQDETFDVWYLETISSAPSQTDGEVAFGIRRLRVDKEPVRSGIARWSHPVVCRGDTSDMATSARLVHCDNVTWAATAGAHGVVVERGLSHDTRTRSVCSIDNSVSGRMRVNVLQEAVHDKQLYPPHLLGIVRANRPDIVRNVMDTMYRDKRNVERALIEIVTDYCTHT